MRFASGWILLCALLTLLASAPASARPRMPARMSDDVTLTFSASPITGAQGSSIAVRATIKNNSNHTINLNLLTVTFNDTDLLVADISAFFTGFVGSLEAGKSISNSTLFSVSIDAALGKGVYSGTAAVLGGGDDAALDNLAQQDFQIKVIDRDTTPPTTSIRSGPDDGGTVGERSVTFTFTGSDNVTPTERLTYQYKLDDGEWTASSGTSATVTVDSDGPHTFQVAAIDESANVDPKPASRRFLVDTSEPAVSNVQAGNIGDVNATITWDSNKPTTSQVEYRALGDDLWSATTQDTTYVTAHRVTITGLRPTTTYQFRVRSQDRLAREIVSDTFTLVTLRDTVPPHTALTTAPREGGAVQPGDIVFAWTGSDDATPTNQLRYQYQIDDGLWTPSTADTLTTVTLTLAGNGDHVFRVQAQDASGNTDPLPAVVHFRTDGTAPRVLTLNVSNITFISAQVSWTTDKPTTGTVQYAIGDGDFKFSYSDPNLDTSHTLGIGPLASNTLYRVRMIGQDEAGNQVVSQIATFTSGKLRDASVAGADLSFSSPSPASGDQITMTARVKNVGDVAVSGTLVFYDYSAKYGRQEVGRSTFSLPAYSASDAVLTSPAFTVLEGLHSPFVQILDASPGDDIGSNNVASVDLLVNAPPYRFSLGVSSPKTWPGDDSLFTAIIKNTGSRAQTLDGLKLTGPAWIVLASDLPTNPIPPGGEVEVTFRMTPPPTETGGTLTNPVLRTLVLSLPGTQTQFAAQVYSGPVCGLSIKVVDDTTGAPISGATVALDNTDQQYVTGPEGIPLNSLGQPAAINSTPGSRTVFAIAGNYLPASVNTDCSLPVVVRLKPGKALEVTQVRVTPLTIQEVVARGVDLKDPQNYQVFDFAVDMKVGTLPIRNVILPRHPVAGFVFTGGGSGVIPGGVGGNTAAPDFEVDFQYHFTYPTTDPTQRTETWIVIPGNIRVLKQFWEASVFVKNNTNFSIEDVLASLEVPGGLTLPDLFGKSQSTTQPLGTIAPLTQKQAQWVVRGDRAGTYQLTGRANGRIVLGGSTVPLQSSLKSDEFTVIVPRLRLTFGTPGAVKAGQVFTLNITVTNESPIALNAISVNLYSDRLVNCVLAPGQAASVDIGTLQVGESRTVSFQLQSLVTGNVTPLQTFVTGVPAEPPVEVVPSPNDPPSAVDDTASVLPNTPANVAVLANDSDPNGDSLSVTSVTQGSSGSVTLNDDNTVTYRSAAGFLGTDRFTYTISDGRGGTATANVNVTVTTARALDVTGLVGIRKSGWRYSYTTQHWIQTLTLTNISNSTLTGPLALVLDRLSANAGLVGKTGLTSATLPSGSPYRDVSMNNLAPGKSVTVTLEFTNANSQGISYGVRILDGSGSR